jgi:hypothetical protein
MAKTLEIVAKEQLKNATDLVKSTEVEVQKAREERFQAEAIATLSSRNANASVEWLARDEAYLQLQDILANSTEQLAKKRCDNHNLIRFVFSLLSG